MAKKVTTLFIRDDSATLLVMAGRRVEKWASLPLDPGLVSQGLVNDQAKLAEKLKELFKLQKVPMGKVIAGISGHDSVYRIINLPELPEAVLPEAVKREAKRVIPVPLEEVYLSYQPLEVAQGETAVFLTAFPRNIADSLYQTLHKAGLQPYIMDLAPLALCRTLNEPRAVLVNARADHLDIMVMVNQIPQLIRRLSLPSEAESPSERLATITEEIDRTIAFYNSSHQEEPLNETVPMFVSGDLAREEKNWKELGGKAENPIAVLPVPVEFPEGFDPNEFMVNIGLAFKVLLAEKGEENFSLVNINTLPEVYLPKPVRLPNILAPIAIVIGLGVLVYLGTIVFQKNDYLDTLRDQLEPLEIAIAQQNLEIGDLEENIGLLETKIAALGATTDIFDTTFDSLEEVRDRTNQDVSQLVSLLPGSVDLTEVNHSGEMVTVSGLCPNENGIFEYARALRSGERYSLVIIDTIEAVEEDDEIQNYRFDFLLYP